MNSTFHLLLSQE